MGLRCWSVSNFRWCPPRVLISDGDHGGSALLLSTRRLRRLRHEHQREKQQVHDDDRNASHWTLSFCYKVLMAVGMRVIARGKIVNRNHNRAAAFPLPEGNTGRKGRPIERLMRTA